MSDVSQDTLDALQQQIQGLKGEESSMMAAPDEHGDIDQDDIDDTPEGFKDYDQYIADGGDPAFFKGKAAYAEQKEILAELKQIKKRAAERDEQMASLTEHFDKERQRLLSEIQSRKEQAEKDLDFDSYKQLEKQERELQGRDAQPQQDKEHPVIASFRLENGAINPADPDFDPVHASAFSAAFNAMVAQAQQRAGRDLNDAEIRRYLDATQKRLSPPAIQRQPKVEGTRRATPKADPVSKMPAEVRDLYERWSKDPKRKNAAAKLIAQYGA